MTEAEARSAKLSSNQLERLYEQGSNPEVRRKLGQFFTPFAVASFMSQWLEAALAGERTLLDPCAGLGVFERALCALNPRFAVNTRFTLWEKDQGLVRELRRVCTRLGIQHHVHRGDFLNSHSSSTYDAIIANPPYYKHHFVENKRGIRNSISAKVGGPFSVTTNVYCWFLIKCLSMLQQGGRLAFIVPSEFLNANYGRDVKKYLLSSGYLRHLISICYKSRTFDDAITTTCVLLAERNEDRASGIRFYQVKSSNQLKDLQQFLDAAEFAEYGPDELDVKRKWRSYLPGNRIARFPISALVPLSTYGHFSRGIATGANRFFALDAARALELNLPRRSLVPCVCKSRQATGKRFTDQDFKKLERAGKTALLFDGQAATGAAVDRYVRFGEQSGYQRRYLTRTRKPWYALEKRSPARIWARVFGREGIRFVWNESRCVTLTCFHAFQPNELGRACLPFLFLYLNTPVARQLLDLEKREYGDGLDKYEPNDINQAMAPDFRRLDNEARSRLARLQCGYILSRPGSAEEKACLDEADARFRSSL